MSPRDIQIAILWEICDPLRINIDDVLGRKRYPRIVEARQRCMRAMRARTSHSLTQIGRFFGRDHTTVGHALRLTDRIFDELPPLPLTVVPPPPKPLRPRFVVPVFADELPVPPPAPPRHSRYKSLAERLYHSERRARARVEWVHGPRCYERFNLIVGADR